MLVCLFLVPYAIVRLIDATGWVPSPLQLPSDPGRRVMALILRTWREDALARSRCSPPRPGPERAEKEWGSEWPATSYWAGKLANFARYRLAAFQGSPLRSVPSHRSACCLGVRGAGKSGNGMGYWEGPALHWMILCIDRREGPEVRTVAAACRVFLVINRDQGSGSGPRVQGWAPPQTREAPETRTDRRSFPHPAAEGSLGVQAQHGMACPIRYRGASWKLRKGAEQRDGDLSLQTSFCASASWRYEQAEATRPNLCEMDQQAEHVLHGIWGAHLQATTKSSAVTILAASAPGPEHLCSERAYPLICC